MPKNVVKPLRFHDVRFWMFFLSRKSINQSIPICGLQESLCLFPFDTWFFKIKVQSTNQPTNQPTTAHPTKQPILQPTNLATNQSYNQPTLNQS